ncbi:MAG: CAP domain-containing protein [Pseudonocardia sp.]
MTRRALRMLIPAAALAALAASALLTGVAQALPPLPPLDGGPGAGGSSSRTEPAEPAARPEQAAPAAEPAQAPPTEPARATRNAPRTGSGWATRIVALTNDERARAGCDGLAVDDRLVAAAQMHARDMADHDHMSHVGSDGSTFDERIEAAGYDEPGGENVAYGYPDPETTMREWMASPGHRENIVNCDFVTIGVGHDPRGDFVAQEFGLPEYE